MKIPCFTMVRNSYGKITENGNRIGIIQVKKHESKMVTSEKTLQTILNLFQKNFAFLWKGHSYAM